MRIVYISSSEYPHPTANGVQVVKQCNAFSRIVEDVLLLGRYAQGNDCSAKDIRLSYQMKDKVRLSLMNYSILPAIVRSLLYPLWTALKTPPNTELVYGRHLLSLLVVALFRRPQRVMYECHAPPRGYLKYVLWMLNGLGVFRFIIVISAALKGILLKQFPYLDADIVIVAHDGCDPQPDVFFEQWSLSAGYVGGVYRGRGLDLIVELASKMSTVDFHVVGGNEQQLRAVTNMDIPSNVICHGYVSQAQLSEYYKKFTVALAPYATAVDTPDGTDTSAYMSPLKIFEYMGWGKIVIASDLPVLREVLVHGGNSLLVPAERPSDWVVALHSLSDEKLAKSLAARAYHDASAYFSWDKRADDILKLI